MSKAHQVRSAEGQVLGWLIECPGCGEGHLFDDRWRFNGNPERPTFSPSMLVESPRRCHSYVRDGFVEFLRDCDHELAGSVHELPAIDRRPQSP